MKALWSPAGHRGFTLLEVTIAGSLIAGLVFVLVPYMRQPTFLALNRSVNMGEYQRKSLHAMDIVINDLKEAYPPSLNWDLLPPAAGTPLLDRITFTKANYVPGQINPTNFNTIDIRYNAASRQLIRTETPPGVGVTPQVSVLFENLEPPSAANPLFQKDPDADVYHMIVVTLLYTPSGMPVQRLIRRIAAKG